MGGHFSRVLSDERTKDGLRGLTFGECVLCASYRWSIVSVVLATPIGIRRKSYVPLAILGTLGASLDMLRG